MTDSYNAAERRHVKLAEKAAKASEIQRRDFLVATLSHVQGRLWFWELLGSCRVFATTHTGNALNTAFAEGQRNIGLMVLADIMRYCPDQYIQMTREANERESVQTSRLKPDQVEEEELE